MNKRRRYRAVLILGTVGLLIVGTCGLWLRSERRQQSFERQKSLDRQQSLNWQLLESVWEGPTEQALVLVNEGADPNTPYEPGPSASLQDLSNLSVAPAVWPHDNPVSAFMMACCIECLIGDNAFRSVGMDSSSSGMRGTNSSLQRRITPSSKFGRVFSTAKTSGAVVQRRMRSGASCIWRSTIAGSVRRPRSKRGVPQTGRKWSDSASGLLRYD